MGIERGLWLCRYQQRKGEYWGLVHGLRQATTSGYSPLQVIDNSTLVLSQHRTRHPLRKPHLLRLFRGECFRGIATDVSSCGHHYRNYSEMADRPENIAIDTEASFFVHAPSEGGVVTEALDLSQQSSQPLEGGLSHCTIRITVPCTDADTPDHLDA